MHVDLASSKGTYCIAHVQAEVSDFAGHVHAYERTHPVYDYNLDPCGAVHITIGDGGNSEGLSFLTKDKQFSGTVLLLPQPLCLHTVTWDVRCQQELDI